MGVYIDDKTLLIIAEPKAISFDLPKDVDKNLKHGIDFTIKRKD